MYYLRQSTFIFLYVVFMSLTATAITYIPIPFLKVLLLVANLILFSVITANNFYREGQVAMKIRLNNDIIRKKIAETGDDLPLKKQAEYTTLKGYLLGAIVFVPCVVLLLINTLVMLLGGTNIIGSIVSVGYMLFFWVYSAFGTEIVSPFTYYIVLWGAGYLALLSGLFFTLGAKKQEESYQAMEQMHEIYGEKK